MKCVILPISQRTGQHCLSKFYRRRDKFQFIISSYRENYNTLMVGTGDSPLTIPFYEKCGFVESHRIKNFFIDNYDHPIYEAGERLIDMVYFKRVYFYASSFLFVNTL